VLSGGGLSHTAEDRSVSFAPDTGMAPKTPPYQWHPARWGEAKRQASQVGNLCYCPTGWKPVLPEDCGLTMMVQIENDEFGSSLRRRRNEMGLTLKDVVDRVGCRVSYLSMIETGRRPPPGEALLELLERALELEPGHLVEAAQWFSTPNGVKKQVKQLESRRRQTEAFLERLRQGSEGLDEMMANGSLQRFVEEHSANVDSPKRLLHQIPIINNVAAGYPRQFTDLDYPARVADEYLTCPDLIDDTQAFAARVVGDSMEPVYCEGDTVVFSPDAPTPSGCDCFVRLLPDNETTFKRVVYDGLEAEFFLDLEPLNTVYPKRTVHREVVGGLYAAVYVMRPIR